MTAIQGLHSSLPAVTKIGVLNAITGLNIGGAELMLSRFACSLGPTDYRPSVLSLMTPGLVARLLSEHGIAVETLDLGSRRLSPRTVIGLRRAVASADADIVHGWMYHGNLAASIGAMLHRRQPVVWSIHHSIDDLSAEKSLTQWIIRMLAGLSGSVAAISYCSRVAAAQHEALGFDPSKRVVIPNGINCSVFRPDDTARARLLERYRIPGNRLVVANVARAHPMKSHGTFVRALARLRDEGLEVHGLVIGHGHEDGEAQKAVAEHNMHDRMTLPGPAGDINRILSGVDVYMLSSAWGEAFPLSVAEAMACGTPSVVTDVGDCRWLVGNDDLVAPPRDDEALATAVRRIIELDPAERRQVGLAARLRIVDHFSLERYTDSHLAIYEKAICRRSARERA